MRHILISASDACEYEQTSENRANRRWLCSGTDGNGGLSYGWGTSRKTAYLAYRKMRMDEIRIEREDDAMYAAEQRQEKRDCAGYYSLEGGR